MLVADSSFLDISGARREFAPPIAVFTTSSDFALLLDVRANKAEQN